MLANIFINFLAQGYLFLISFFTLPAILHYLGKEQFGFLALAAALLNYATTFDFGFGAALTQRVAYLHSQNRRQQLKTTIQTGFLTYTLLAAAIIISLDLFAQPILHLFNLSPQLFGQAQKIMPLIALNIGLYFPTIFAASIFQAENHFWRYNLRTFIVGTANTLGVFFLASRHFPLIAIFQLQTAALLLTLALDFWLLRSYLAYPHFSRRHFLQLGRFALFKFLSNTAGQISTQFPKFFLASLVNVASVSYFTVPFSLIQKLGVILSQIYIVFFPKIAHLNGRQQSAKIRRLFQRGQLLVAIITIPAIALGFWLGPLFLNWWLKDPQFVRQILPVFNILLVYFLVHAFTAIPVAILEGINQPQLPALLAWINAAITIGGGYFLIKRLAAPGAALTLLGYTLVTGPSVILLAWRSLKIPKPAPKPPLDLSSSQPLPQ